MLLEAPPISSVAVDSGCVPELAVVVLNGFDCGGVGKPGKPGPTGPLDLQRNKHTVVNIRQNPLNLPAIEQTVNPLY